MGLLSGHQEKNRETHKTFKKTFYPNLPGTVSIVLKLSLFPVTS